MSNKFNETALNDYSRAYARHIATEFFQQHTVINGQQILSLTPISQVNLLVVSRLADKWQADAEKFRSSYFDFTHGDVKEALAQFMNVVSQHIAVRREAFEPLLAEAVRQTITLLFDPRDYFDEWLRDQPEFILTDDAMQHLVRYTRINRFIPAYMVQRMNGRKFVYVNQAITYLDEALTQKNAEQEPYQPWVDLFSEKVPMNVPALLRHHIPDAIPAQPGRSFFETATASEAVQPPRPETPTDSETPAPAPEPADAPAEPIRRPAKAETTSGPLFLETQTATDPVDPIAQPSQVETEPMAMPHIAVAESAEPELQTPTLNQTLHTAVAEPMTVAETFNRAPIESVGRSISLNQKFRFINQLFNGNAAAYNQAIAELDKLKTYGEALDLVSYRYASQYLWDMSSDEVSDLIDILKRRFA